MKKRGELTMEEIVKIVLGVIGILILVGLSISLGGLFAQKTTYEQAKATMSELESIVNTIEEGESRTFLVQGPERSSLIWLKDSICMCLETYAIAVPQMGGTKIYENLINECYTKGGVCIPRESITILHDEPTYYRQQMIIFRSAPAEIGLTKVNGNVSISFIE